MVPLASMPADPKTLSETRFEQSLSDNGLTFEAVSVADSPRPDYADGDGTSWRPLLFEVLAPHGILTVRLFPNEHAELPMPTGLPHRFEIIW